MKAQISRDSFKKENQYSAVYQQQGRMITDADWNEMVRILKQRMDRTVGASIASGSPREGGILTEEIANKKWVLPDEKFVEVEKLRWGRVYVNGMYGEIQPLDPEELNKLGVSEEEQIKIMDEPSILAFLMFQRDYHRLRMITANRPYVAYIDLWERLVIGLEDEELNDSALHGADTCVRTQTMSQVKIAEIDQASFDKGAEDWESPAECGNAMIRVEKTTSAPATASVCDGETQKIEEYRRRNTLFRLEVHAAYSDGGKHKVMLKWSSENGAEQHKNDPDLPNFWDDDHIYECYSDLSEKLMGVHTTSPANGPEILEEAKLYTYLNYKEERNNVDSAASKMIYVRRWDGYLALERADTQKSWDLVEEESNPNATISFKTISSDKDAQKLIINDVIEGHKLEFVISRWIKEEGEPRKKESCLFVTGDYWFVLVRDQGSKVNAEVLTQQPVGIHHQYLVLGAFKFSYPGTSHLRLSAQQWRRLSFPSLTNLTLDRVLVKDKSEKEISVEDKFVEVDGDTMTGDLKVRANLLIANPSNGHTQIKLSAGNEARIDFNPQGSGSSESAWIKASTKDVATGRRTTLELGVEDDGLDDILLNSCGDILLDADYNVGIGTKSPHAKLDVKGPVRIDSRERTDQAAENEPEPQASGSLAGRGFLETPWVYTEHLQGPSGELTLTANNIFLDAENDVEIATTAPGGNVIIKENLHVQGYIYATDRVITNRAFGDKTVSQEITEAFIFCNVFGGGINNPPDMDDVNFILQLDPKDTVAGVYADFQVDSITILYATGGGFRIQLFVDDIMVDQFERELPENLTGEATIEVQVIDIKLRGVVALNPGVTHTVSVKWLVCDVILGAATASPGARLIAFEI